MTFLGLCVLINKMYVKRFSTCIIEYIIAMHKIICVLCLFTNKSGRQPEKLKNLKKKNPNICQHINIIVVFDVML